MIKSVSSFLYSLTKYLNIKCGRLKDEYSISYENKAMHSGRRITLTYNVDGTELNYNLLYFPHWGMYRIYLRALESGCTVLRDWLKNAFATGSSAPPRIASRRHSLED